MNGNRKTNTRTERNKEKDRQNVRETQRGKMEQEGTERRLARGEERNGTELKREKKHGGMERTFE